MKNIDRKAGEGSSSSSNKSVWNTGSPDDTLSMSVEEMSDAKDPHAADGYIKAANANPETPSFGDAAHNKQDKHKLHRKVIAGMLVAALASGAGVAAKGMAEQKTVDNGNRPAATQVEQDDEKIKEYYTSYEDEKGVTTSHWFVDPDGKETKGMSSFVPRPEGAEYDGSITGSRTDIFENGEGRKKSFTMNSSERMEEAKEKADSKSEEDDERVVEYTTYGRNGNGTTTSHWFVDPDGKETKGMSSFVPRPEGVEDDGSVTGSRWETLANGKRRGKSFYVPGAEASEVSETTKVGDKPAEGSSESEEKIKEYYTSYEDEKGTTTSHWEVGSNGKETRGMSSYTPRPEGAEYDGRITGSRTEIFENGGGRKKSFTMNSSERMEKAKERKDLSATEEPGADDEVEAAVTVAD